jgi:TetR/AcrR family transcriptional regulator
MTERHPEKTRARILEAALAEFAAKGFAGARVEAIAEAAGVNKRMLYHYHGSKEGLYESVLREGICQKRQVFDTAPPPPSEALPFWFRDVAANPAWLRLMAWEALERGEAPVLSEEERTAWMRGNVAGTAAGQSAGVLPADLDPAQLTITLFALVAFPMAFPQIARLLTGRNASDPAFQKARAAHLAAIGALLERPGRPPAKSPPRAAKPSPRASVRRAPVPKPRRRRNDRTE